jgi:hypothetical protein
MDPERGFLISSWTIPLMTDEARAVPPTFTAETISRINAVLKRRFDSLLHGIEGAPISKDLMPLLPTSGGWIYYFLANLHTEPQ